VHAGGEADDADNGGNPSAALRRRAIWRMVCLCALALATVALTVAILIHLMAVGTPLQIQWWAQFSIAAALLGAVAFLGLCQWRYWAHPARKLAQLLPQVRAGEATIEELSKVEGGLRVIVLHIQGMLRDLRRQRTQASDLEMEMSQRVANRTDALERSIGALRHQATRDPLTGLYNRRMLEATLQRLADHCRATGESLSLMMIDIDDFKLLNDTIGHAAGDEFLRSVAQLIKSTMRDNDIAFRYGGDEFVVILPATGRQDAQPLSDRLVSLVDGISRTLPLPRAPRLSIGLVNIDETPAAALLAMADKLLYQSKHARKRSRRDAARKRSA
jgi:diguanylate cyclase (GGDEF)-like protein